MAELRTERQREHDLRVRLAGELETVTEQLAQRDAQLADFRKRNECGTEALLKARAGVAQLEAHITFMHDLCKKAAEEEKQKTVDMNEQLSQRDATISAQAAALRECEKHIFDDNKLIVNLRIVLVRARDHIEQEAGFDCDNVSVWTELKKPCNACSSCRARAWLAANPEVQS